MELKPGQVVFLEPGMVIEPTNRRERICSEVAWELLRRISEWNDSAYIRQGSDVSETQIVMGDWKLRLNALEFRGYSRFDELAIKIRLAMDRPSVQILSTLPRIEMVSN